MNRKQALAAGGKWYTPTEPCTKCHTLAERYVANGRCRGCNPPVQPHQPHEPNRGRAKRDGYKIYLPEHECTKCGIKAPRFTSNNRCMGCTDRPKALSIMLIAQYPDMVIQRRDAETMGFVYYRNPYQCQHGHPDWCSVKTGECLTCNPPAWM